jgi:predicted type IV restriction endonuclease
MSSHGTFGHFENELTRLVAHFDRHLADFKGPAYDEANVRKDFLDPFFRALGWDMDNRSGLIPRDREVEIESRTSFAGRHRRADYLFRAGGIDRFVCEAKKHSVELDFRHAFQAKRYAWNKGVHVAVLTDFEHLKVYAVGGRPRLDQPGEVATVENVAHGMAAIAGRGMPETSLTQPRLPDGSRPSVP